MANRTHEQQTLCDRCQWAKDKCVSRWAKACYCTQYGIIISYPKERCKGFKHGQVSEQENRS